MRTVGGSNDTKEGSRFGLATDIPNRDCSVCNVRVVPVALVIDDSPVVVEDVDVPVRTDASSGVMVDVPVGNRGYFGAMSWYRPGGSIGLVYRFHDGGGLCIPVVQNPRWAPRRLPNELKLVSSSKNVVGCARKSLGILNWFRLAKEMPRSCSASMLYCLASS
jgi:hypothetical protein